MAVRVRTKYDCDLLILQHPADKNNNAITPPERFISSLVHASVLLVPMAERVRHKAVCCHVWLPLVPSC